MRQQAPMAPNEMMFEINPDGLQQAQLLDAGRQGADVALVLPETLADVDTGERQGGNVIIDFIDGNGDRRGRMTGR